MDKKCYKCKTVKSCFYRDRTRADGFESICKDCKKIKDRLRKEYFAQWQEKKLKENPEYWKQREQTRDLVKKTASNRKYRLSKYGLDEDSYQAILAAQDNKCAICKREGLNASEKELAIDHDHACCPGNRSCGECVRGLLCQVCNQALGMFQDSEEILLSAIQYLKNSQLNARSVLGSEAGMMAAHFG